MEKINQKISKAQMDLKEKAFIGELKSFLDNIDYTKHMLKERIEALTGETDNKEKLYIMQATVRISKRIKPSDSMIDIISQYAYELGRADTIKTILGKKEQGK